VNNVPPRANDRRYRALGEPMIDPYSWFSMTMTTTGGMERRTAARRGWTAAGDDEDSSADSRNAAVTTTIVPRATSRPEGGRRTTGRPSYRRGLGRHPAMPA
jgi:hypothetical protein